jgi:catechol 1,2-dioxygenase
MQITHDDYKTVVTQIYPKDDPWLSTDTVFAVKDDLVVDFKPLEKLPSSMSEHKGPGGPATKELELDIVLAPTGMAAAADKPVFQNHN